MVFGFSLDSCLAIAIKTLGCIPYSRPASLKQNAFRDPVDTNKKTDRRNFDLNMTILKILQRTADDWAKDSDRKFDAQKAIKEKRPLHLVAPTFAFSNSRNTERSD